MVSFSIITNFHQYYNYNYIIIIIIMIIPQWTPFCWWLSFTFHLSSIIVDHCDGIIIIIIMIISFAGDYHSLAIYHRSLLIIMMAPIIIMIIPRWWPFHWWLSLICHSSQSITILLAIATITNHHNHHRSQWWHNHHWYTLSRFCHNGASRWQLDQVMCTHENHTMISYSWFKSWLSSMTHLDGALRSQRHCLSLIVIIFTL